MLPVRPIHLIHQICLRIHSIRLQQVGLHVGVEKQTEASSHRKRSMSKASVSNFKWIRLLKWIAFYWLQSLKWFTI